MRGVARADDAWFRNDRWDADAPVHFWKRLARARMYNRGQYAQIKAALLIRSRDPERVRAAIAILGRLHPDWQPEWRKSEAAEGHLLLAGAHAVLGQDEKAVAAYRRCLAAEAEFPTVRTGGWPDFARL